MNHVILLVASLLATLHLHAQSMFQQSFSTAKYEYAEKVKEANENGYWIAGASVDSAWGSFLTRTDSSGNEIWTKRYSTILCRDFAIDSLGNGIWVGQGLDNGFRVFISVMKTNPQGDTLWTRHFQAPDQDVANSVAITPEGDYIITGYTSSFLNQAQTFLMKLNPNGHLLWTRAFGGTGSRIGNTVAVSSLGGYLISGIIDTLFSGSYDIFLLRTDTAGNALWAKALDSGTSLSALDMKETPDSGWIMTGTVWIETQPNVAEDNILVLRTDSLGNTNWARLFGTEANDNGNGIALTRAGGFIVTGRSTGFINSNMVVSNCFLIQLDASGILDWCKFYGGNHSADDSGLDVIQTADNGFMAGGRTTDNYEDIYVLKTDSTGQVPCNTDVYPTRDSIISIAHLPLLQTSAFIAFNRIDSVVSVSPFMLQAVSPCTFSVDEPEQKMVVSAYPNPGNGTFRFQGIQETQVLSVHNSSGQVIYERKDVTDETEIQLPILAKGIYFFTLQSPDGRLSHGKLAIQ